MLFKIFSFNPIQVNTVVLYDDTKEAVIVDPGCLSHEEEKTLNNFIVDLDLKPVKVLITHPHIDHVCGLKYIEQQYHIPYYIHEEGIELYREIPYYGLTFGMGLEKVQCLDTYQTLKDGDWIQFGNESLQVIYTPGHAAGSVSYYHQQSHLLLTGDALFKGSIGRTDLPTGNYKTLIESLTKKIIILPEETDIIPGHGEMTTVKYEKHHNPYF